MGLYVRLTSDLGENAVLQHLLNSIKLPLEEKTAFFKIFLTRYEATTYDSSDCMRLMRTLRNE